MLLAGGTIGALGADDAADARPNALSTSANRKRTVRCPILMDGMTRLRAIFKTFSRPTTRTSPTSRALTRGSRGCRIACCVTEHLPSERTIMDAISILSPLKALSITHQYFWFCLRDSSCASAAFTRCRDPQGSASRAFGNSHSDGRPGPAASSTAGSKDRLEGSWRRARGRWCKSRRRRRSRC